MKMLTVNYTHDGSVCLAEAGKILFYSKEERFSRKKRDAVPYYSIKALHDSGLLDGLDEFQILNWKCTGNSEADYTDFYLRMCKRVSQTAAFTAIRGEHHLFHAVHAHATSGFQTSLVFVIDGGGAARSSQGDLEKESVYAFGPGWRECLYQNADRDRLGICDRYDEVSRFLGFDVLDAGKTMGLAAYGRPAAPEVPDQQRPEHISPECVGRYADLAARVQAETSDRALDLIRVWSARTGIRQLCITGGYAMNSVANFRYAAELGPLYTIYVDPLGDDGGIPVGMALAAGALAPQPYRDLYFSGFSYDASAFNGANASTHDVVARLLAGEIGGIFQGRSEAGQRALGNRSILFDPRNPKGRQRLNEVKQREWFRPFAVTVLEPYASRWFDTRATPTNRFMTSVVPVDEQQAWRIPGAVHVDGTCRIQTLSRDDNPRLYDVIEQFDRASGVPMLLNTSLNLAGAPLVESPVDALQMLRRSSLDWVYFADIDRLMTAAT